MITQGRFTVDRTAPEAKGVCDRCGFIYRHRDLQWQYQWDGPKLQNLRLLVCDSCYDTPQENIRTIILPADPVPIMNPRSENYVQDDNPVSPLGTSIGTMTNFAGLDAAFNMGTNKPYTNSAGRLISNSSYANTVGRNWGPNVTQTLSTVSLYAPNDSPFLGTATPYKIQGSNDGVSFTDILSGTTAGTVGEVIQHSIPNGTPYQYHQINFNGDGVTKVVIAQLVMNSANQPPQGDT